MDMMRNLANSADLVTGMMDRLGIDLDAEITRNPRQATVRFRSMALRCSGCADQAGCADLQRACSHLDSAPDYCRNKAYLDAIAQA